MLAYDEFSTFRTPRSGSGSGSRSFLSGRQPTADSRRPLRVEALDDLHRTLYGSLHPAAAIVESDRELVEGDGDSSGAGGSSWLEDNALTAAVAVVGAFALYAWMKKPRAEPLRGPADAPASPAGEAQP